MKKRTIIHRTRIGKDIVAEFAVPSPKALAQGRVAILCGGVPSMPGKNTVMEFLASKGFFVINPRYRGTWESSGVFLREEPTNDIREVIEALQNPLVSLYGHTEYRVPKKHTVYLFASSFGGPAAFLLSKDPRVAKVVALSPVCDWAASSRKEPLEAMNVLTKEIYGEGYRLSKQGWMKLAKGDFYNPMTALNRINGAKILMFHAKDDEIVSPTSVMEFASSAGAELLLARKGGHFGLTEVIGEETWPIVQRFVKK